MAPAIRKHSQIPPVTKAALTSGTGHAPGERRRDVWHTQAYTECPRLANSYYVLGRAALVAALE